MNSFLKWAGSKRKSIPRLLADIPSRFDRYVEPFAGSACLFFQLEPADALLADINKQLIDTYEQLRQAPEDVITELSSLQCDEKDYYRIRGADHTTMSGPQRAARFIYLNRFCFNGLYRTNRSGQFNVPFGGKRGGRLPLPQTLRDCAAALSRITLRSTSFEETLAEVKHGDFVYLDPPYSIRSRRVFNGYAGAVFGPGQLKMLRSHLKRLDKMGVSFLVSYGQSAEAVALGVGFRSRQVVVQRQIAGFAANRRKARELIITNF
jgi:DNA adenine methylase